MVVVFLFGYYNVIFSGGCFEANIFCVGVYSLVKVVSCVNGAVPSLTSSLIKVMLYCLV